jgi:hypothetical protein
LLLRLTCPHEEGLRKNIGRRIRIRPFDDESAKQQRFKSARSAERFLNMLAAVHNTLYLRRHLIF